MYKRKNSQCKRQKVVLNDYKLIAKFSKIVACSAINVVCAINKGLSSYGFVFKNVIVFLPFTNLSFENDKMDGF